MEFRDDLDSIQRAGLSSGGQKAVRAGGDDLFECTIKVGCYVESAMEGHLHRPGNVDQRRRGFDVDSSLVGEQANHDAVGANLFGNAKILLHDCKLMIAVDEDVYKRQVLGDLPVGNGDPSITQFPAKMTPNFHALASDFVDFDNFYDASDVSGDGWPWSTSARTTDTIEKEIPVNYAERGVNNNAEGTNRNLNVGIVSVKERFAANPLQGNDPNVLPGTRNVADPDNDEGEEGQGLSLIHI